MVGPPSCEPGGGLFFDRQPGICQGGDFYLPPLPKRRQMHDNDRVGVYDHRLDRHHLRLDHLLLPHSAHK